VYYGFESLRGADPFREGGFADRARKDINDLRSKEQGAGRDGDLEEMAMRGPGVRGRKEGKGGIERGVKLFG
jgi:hypothetical protein